MANSKAKRTTLISVLCLLVVSCSGDDPPETTEAALPTVPTTITNDHAGDCVLLREIFGVATQNASVEHDNPPPIEVGDMPTDDQIAVIEAGTEALDSIEFRSDVVADAVSDLRASAETVIARAEANEEITQEDLDANVNANLYLGRLCEEVLVGPESPTAPTTTAGS